MLSKIIKNRDKNPMFGLMFSLRNKDIIVVNTKKNRSSYYLAHVLRDFAKTTFCIDNSYKIKENSLNIRRIEQGKVYLIKGDWQLDKAIILHKIKTLGGKPKLVFDIN